MCALPDGEADLVYPGVPGAAVLVAVLLELDAGVIARTGAHGIHPDVNLGLLAVHGDGYEVELFLVLVALQVPGDGVPLVGRELVAFERSVLPPVVGTVPHPPVAAGVIALRAEHVLEAVAEEIRVKLGRLHHVRAIPASGLGGVPHEMNGVENVVGPVLWPEMVGEHIIGPGHPAADVGFHAIAVERGAGDALLEPISARRAGAAGIAGAGPAIGPALLFFHAVPGFGRGRRGGNQAAGGGSGG